MEEKKPNKIKKKIFRTKKGTIVSDKMDKTAVVKVDRLKEHPRYKKRYRISRRYKAHDPKNEYKVGDKVIIQECRPLSKGKKWRIISRVNPSARQSEPDNKK